MSNQSKNKTDLMKAFAELDKDLKKAQPQTPKGFVSVVRRNLTASQQTLTIDELMKLITIDDLLTIISWGD